MGVERVARRERRQEKNSKRMREDSTKGGREGGLMGRKRWETTKSHYDRLEERETERQRERGRCAAIKQQLQIHFNICSNLFRAQDG